MTPIETLFGKAVLLWIQNFELARVDYPWVFREKDCTL